MTNATIRNRANIANWYMIKAGMWVSGAGKLACVAVRNQDNSWTVRGGGRIASAKTLCGATANFGKPNRAY